MSRDIFEAASAWEDRVNETLEDKPRPGRVEGSDWNQHPAFMEATPEQEAELNAEIAKIHERYGWDPLHKTD